MKKIISTAHAPIPVGPYSQGIQTNSLLFVSGQIPMDPVSGKMVLGSIQDQVERVLENVKAIVEAAGGNLSNVVKTTIFLKDLKNFEAVNQVYSEYFGESKPARSTVEVSQLPKGAEMEIEAIAVLEKQ
ncbi:MAG: RidA family protein [Chlamydiae bacterium]|nr:RidA family protein [Chlamydiota bacterium]MBI3266664.1 RidA family protein [Chlamydiota bacterium]